VSLARRSGLVLRRTAVQAVPTVIGIVVLDFFFLRLMPGDAADVIAGQSGSATAAVMTALRSRLGLDQPVLRQLVGYLWGLAHLDFGQSAQFGTPVFRLIMQRLPATLLLMVTALGVALVVGILLGWIMAVFVGRWPDRILQVLVLLSYSTPGFWIGLMAIVLFSVKLGWLPANGNMTVGAAFGFWGAIGDRLRYLVLPALSLAAFFVAVYARLTRASLLEVQRLDFMRAAAAKGLHPLVLQFRHALRNALIPVTTVAGMHLGNLLGGAVVVETVYSWPGMGQLALQAVIGRDYGVLLGVLLFSSVLVIVANMLIDLLHAVLDPRVELR
jgi:peptide/nickel transport system permease protein